MSNIIDPSIIYLKIDTQHLVRTGFKDKYNELLDTTVHNAYLNTTSGKIVFQREKGDIEIDFSLTGLADVDISGASAGDVLSYNGSAWVAGQGGGSLSYIRPDYSSRSGFGDVGDITSITDALDKILYPYQTPSFSSFSLSGRSSTLELGQYLSTSIGDDETFVWGVSHTENLDQTYGFSIDDISGGSFSVSGLMPYTLTSYTGNVGYPITKTANGANYSFRISTRDTKNNIFTRNRTFTWRPRMMWGTSSSDSALSSAEIIALPSSVSGGSALVSGITRTFNMDGDGKYIWICHLASLGSAIDDDGNNSRFLVGGLPNSAWQRFTVSFTNSYGHTASYYLYRTDTVQFGTGINIQIV